ncbi:MAG: Crp/Fnr family transcriptional regulator [Chlorobiales bacterium]|nr:Crp/Fnr family transcriptional regulator [Chlorobiales bacterium]
MPPTIPKFLNRLNKSIQEKLTATGRERLVEIGEELFREGMPPRFLPIILSGKVKVVKYLEKGKEAIINIFSDGDTFVIPPLIDNMPYPATAIAIEPTCLIQIEREDFLELLRSEPEFASAITTELSKLLREKNTVIRELATQSPEHRILVTLLRIIDKSSEAAGVPIVVKLRRQDIAEMAGLTTETTIRVIRQLAERKVVKIERGKIIIERPDALKTELKMCPLQSA